jgi:hypothetical protein
MFLLHGLIRLAAARNLQSADARRMAVLSYAVALTTVALEGFYFGTGDKPVAAVIVSLCTRELAGGRGRGGQRGAKGRPNSHVTHAARTVPHFVCRRRHDRAAQVL